MAIGVYFRTNSTLDQYNEVWKRLDAAGLHDPKGRLAHSSWGKDGELEVFDIWESQADFDAFGKELMPMLADLGVEATPNIVETHRVVIP